MAAGTLPPLCGPWQAPRKLFRERERRRPRSIGSVNPSPRTERSYRALLAVPGLPRILVSMQLSRIAQSMVGVTLVLFTLAEYHSPALTGLVTFVSVFPGLLVAPIAGALLDRHGRTRFVILDYAVALVALSLIGGLALAHALPVPVLLAITVVSSLTAILSNSGLRSLFPILVPERLWERVNAIDSNGYLIATILGPPIAAALVSLVGGATTLILIGILYGAATIAMIGAPDPMTETAGSAQLLVAAWEGLRYTVGNSTLRGLAVSISLLNLSGGMITIVVPLIVLDRLHAPEVVVGLVFAGSGVAGMIAALVTGPARQPRQGVGPARPADGRARLRGPAPARRRAGATTAAARARVPRHRPGGRRPAQRPDGHRPVHDPPAPDGPGLDGPGLRGLDGLQLHRLPDRRGAGRRDRGDLDRGGDRGRRAGVRRRGDRGCRADPAPGPAPGGAPRSPRSGRGGGVGPPPWAATWRRPPESPGSARRRDDRDRAGRAERPAGRAAGVRAVPWPPSLAVAVAERAASALELDDDRAAGRHRRRRSPASAGGRSSGRRSGS